MAATNFTETPGGLLYRERLSPWVRVLALVIGVAMFLIPIPFVQHGHWREPSAGTLVAVAGVVFAVLAGVVFVAIALAGVRRIEFDLRQRRLLCTTIGPLGVRRFEAGFDRIERIELVWHDGLDDPGFYEMAMHLAGRRRPLALGVYDTRDEAETWQRRVLAEVAA